MNACTIVGYTYQAETFCPTCMLSVIEISLTTRNLRAHSPEHGLDMYAELMHVDRGDERSFDSSDFPKVVFAYQVEDQELCGTCAEALV